MGHLWKSRPLYKTTIVIWSEGRPAPDIELQDIGREADEGEFYCSKCTTDKIEDPVADPDWDETEFFDRDGESGNEERTPDPHT